MRCTTQRRFQHLTWGVKPLKGLTVEVEVILACFGVFMPPPFEEIFDELQAFYLKKTAHLADCIRVLWTNFQFSIKIRLKVIRERMKIQRFGHKKSQIRGRQGECAPGSASATRIHGFSLKINASTSWSVLFKKQ